MNRTSNWNLAIQIVSQHSLPVFPCREMHSEYKTSGKARKLYAKAPYTRNGFKDATLDLGLIDQFWSEHPNAIVGVPMGKASGLIAIDIDEGGNKCGEETFAALKLGNPRTVQTRTLSGGRHLFFRCSETLEIRNDTSTVFGKDIDVRGEGGYVIWAGSKAAEGGYAYIPGFSPDDVSFAEIPENFLKCFTSKTKCSSNTYGKEGNRNNDLFSAAVKQVHAGANDAQVRDFALKANQEFKPPLPFDEVTSVVRSASSYRSNAQYPCTDLGNAERLKRDLVQDYRLLKYRLGRMPMMTDFVSSDLRDPFQFVEYSKSYLNFVKMVEDETTLEISSVALKLLEYYSKDINDGKRVEESLVLKYLLTSVSVDISELKSFCVRQYGFTLDEKSLESVINNINLRFVTEPSSGKRIPVGDIHGYDLLQVNHESLVRGGTLAECLKEDLFKEFVTDSVQFSIHRFNSRYNPGEFVGGFQRYQKYSRKDVFRILSWGQNPIGLNVGEYKVSPDKSNCPIFLNYEKEEGISDTTKYEDHFNDQSTVTYMSKNKRTLKSPEVLLMQNQGTNGIRLPLFVKKSNAESTEHYFIGDLAPIEESFSEEMMPVGGGPDVSVVKMVFSLDKIVEENLYKYLTSVD